MLRVQLRRSLGSRRADRALEPPTSSSLADEKRVGSFLLSTAARDPRIADLLSPAAYPRPRLHRHGRLGT
jgi:hypothetical protein